MARSSGNVVERLAEPAGRPVDLQRRDRRGRAEPDRGSEAVATEARPAADHPVARGERRRTRSADRPGPGADGGAVGPGADQLDVQPVVAVARVLEQDVVGLVARRCAAGLEKHVDVAVAVPVGERDSVPLLEVAGAGRGGHVLEPLVPRRS